MRATLCAMIVAALSPGGALAAPKAEYVGTFEIPDHVAYLGGFSGLTISADGGRFVLLSDSAALVGGTLERRADGAVTAVHFDSAPVRLRDERGAELVDPADDSEGLAEDGGGHYFISFELLDRVARYDADGRLLETLPIPPAFADFEYNSGLETIARDSAGAIWVVPEGDAGGMRAAPLFRFRSGAWDQPVSISEDQSWRPVDAKFGPDGRLYLLERDFWPLLGFMSRLRRITLGPDGIVDDEVLFHTRAGLHGNLEGLGLWTDSAGALHATMVTDNNFLAVQDSAFVDYRIDE